MNRPDFPLLSPEAVARLVAMLDEPVTPEAAAFLAEVEQARKDGLFRNLALEDFDFLEGM